MNPLELLLGIGAKVIDRLFPDPAQKAQAQLELFKLQQSGELAELAASVQLATNQSNVNAEEAKSENLFKSGWRPFIGWVCGTGLAIQFIVSPILSWGSRLFNHPVDLPSLDLSVILTLLFGMLGLGVLRTHEKINGVS
jgi:hypothetical protein